MRWLLLHGTPLDAEVWDEVRRELKHDSVAPDLNDLIAAQPPGLLQTQLAAAVLAWVPDGDLVVVGHSFGGQVAIELALLAPHRVSRLIVVCTRHTPFPAFADGARAIREGLRVEIDASLRRWFTPEQLAAGPPVIGYLRHRLATAPKEPWAASLDAVARYDRTADVGRLTPPTDLIAAGQDEVSPPSVMAELATALPHARLQTVDAWTHMSPFAEPAEFAARLEQAAGYPLRRE